MKKSTPLLIIALITLLQACQSGEQCIDEEEAVWTDSIVYFHGSLFTGCVNSYDSNGKLILVSSVVDGKNNGEMKETYASGDLKYKTHWKDNYLHGKFTEYYSGNKLKFEGSFVKGKLNGSSISYFENGNVEAKKSFEMGKPTGTHQTFFQNGILSSKTQFQNNVMHGEYVDFNHLGDTATLGYYRNGIQDSLWCFPERMSIVKKDKSRTVFNQYIYHISDTVSIDVSNYALRQNQWNRVVLDTLYRHFEFQFDRKKQIIEIIDLPLSESYQEKVRKLNR